MLRTQRIAIAFALTVCAVSPFAMQTANAKKPTIISSSSTATDLTINGEDLGPGAASVLLGSFGPLAVTGQTPTQLVVTLPGGLAPGNYVLSVQVGKGRGDVDESVVTIGAGGLQGPKGETGADGAVGPKGETGAAGRDGVNGVDGQRGLDGPAGRDGKDGMNGADGIKGEQGVPGPKGDQGEQGVPGGANIPDFNCDAGSFVIGFKSGQPVCSALPDIIFLQGFGTNIPNFRALDMDTAAIVSEPFFDLVQGDIAWDGFALFGSMVPSPSAGAPTKSACQAVPVYPPSGSIVFPLPLQFYCVKTSQGRFGYMQFISGSGGLDAVVNWTTWQ